MSDVRLIDANAMRDDWLENGENEYIYDTNAVLESIDSQPTISAVPVVHGRWEDATEITAGIRFPQTRCTACGKVYWGYRTECYYCPNCGARMDGGADT